MTMRDLPDNEAATMPCRWVTVDEFCQIDSDEAAELGHMNIPGRYVGGTRVDDEFFCAMPTRFPDGILRHAVYSLNESFRMTSAEELYSPWPQDRTDYHTHLQRLQKKLINDGFSK